MADDWIPMRCDLAEDPAVIAVALATGLDEFAVVGRLHRLWCWANKHLLDGNASCVTESWVDRYLSAPGFAQAMVNAGWLDVCLGGISFPKFERWNSKGAKKRVLTARRVAEHRGRGNAECNAHGVTGALPKEEKRKEEQEKSPPTPRGGVDGGENYPNRPADGSEDDPGKRAPERRQTSATGRTPTPEAIAAAETIVDPGANAEAVPFARLIDVWVEAKLPGHDAAGGIRADSKRRGWWEIRLRSTWWATNWEAGLRRAGRSLKARGMGSFPKPLRLDTFLSDELTLSQILEGNFDDIKADPKPNPAGPQRGGTVRDKFDRIRQRKAEQTGGTNG